MRFAADRVTHDGYTLNTYDDSHINGLDIYSVRGSLRWTPTDKTTVDLAASHTKQNDDSMRASKQLCATDPTGILGCLPDATGFGVVNPNGTYTSVLPSKQAMQDATGGYVKWSGLTDINDPFISPVDGNPASLRAVNTDILPKRKVGQNLVTMTVHQEIAPWLSANAIGGYQDGSTYSLENFNNTVGAAFPAGSIAKIVATGANPPPPLSYTSDDAPIPSGQIWSDHFARLFTPPNWPAGKPIDVLPMSGINGAGYLSGDPKDVIGWYPNATSIDVSKGSGKQYSAEIRFQSSLEGRFNFMFAANYIRGMEKTDYYVTGNTLTYAAIMYGYLQSGYGLYAGQKNIQPECNQLGCIRATPFYHNDGYASLESRAAYGEVYYDAIPDELKFTAGARFTQDIKSSRNRIFQIAGPVPIGTNTEADAAAFLQRPIISPPPEWDPDRPPTVEYPGYDFDPSTPGIQLYQTPHGQWDRWSGRALVNWTPKLDFTDQTMIYASYQRGYKAGGFNPGIIADQTTGLSPKYGPEGVDSIEIGTKNMLFESTLSFDWSAFYYNYQGMQISQIINNSAVASNVNAHMFGMDASVTWAPGSHWQFDANVGLLNSALGDTQIMDPRDPTAGRKDVLLVKDYSASSAVASNCVLYRNPNEGPGTKNLSFEEMFNHGYQPDGYFAPPGGIHALRTHGIENVAYGLCDTHQHYSSEVPTGVVHTESQYDFDLDDFVDVQVPETTKMFGAPNSPYTVSDPLKGPDNTKNNEGGVGKQLKGNEIPLAPPVTLSIGAQYDFDLDGGYHVVPRLDGYWKASMWGRVFHDAPDRIASSYNLNFQVQLNAPDDQWYAQMYVKNLTNNTDQTGEYLGSPSSGLYTNAFVDDPRTFGLRLGAKL